MSTQAPKKGLEIRDDGFRLNGQPFRILSGAMHYFRVLPELWEDRLLKLRAMGLNTVETYIAWNLHERKAADYDFSGPRDFSAFVQLAAKLGLHVILRPGPYICAEWDFGGLPSWLLKDENMRVRCLHLPFLEAVDRWFDALVPRIVPLLATRGGPVIACQVENEYGSYGTDRKYMQFVEMALRQRGIDVPMFTSDGPSDIHLEAGSIPGVLRTVNFGSRVAESLARLRSHQLRGPLMVAEFWCGWFDHWGDAHHVRNPTETANTLDEILAAGASVNFYMFHGGTNFGFLNGANCDDTFQPTVTSYDYDAPLSESGDPTEKYFLFQSIIRRHTGGPELRAPRPSPKKAYAGRRMPEIAPLFENLDKVSAPARRTMPECMEKLGQSHGFILYRTEIHGPRPAEKLFIDEPHDRALVYLDGQLIAIVERGQAAAGIEVAVPGERARLDILVENMGRVNFGPQIHDRKGITNGVRLGRQFLFHWSIWPLPLEQLDRLDWQPLSTAAAPCFFRAQFNIHGAPADTFLALPGWTKGVAWINGFNIGRYWNRGPQKTLYVPAPLLREGANELIVLELHGSETHAFEFHARPEL